MAIETQKVSFMEYCTTHSNTFGLSVVFMMWNTIKFSKANPALLFMTLRDLRQAQKKNGNSSHGSFKMQGRLSSLGSSSMLYGIMPDIVTSYYWSDMVCTRCCIPVSGDRVLLPGELNIFNHDFRPGE